MFNPSIRHRSFLLRFRILLLGAVALTLSGGAIAEPPSRVARLAYLRGIVSFSAAGQPDWVRATINRPLTTGDRLWVDANSLAELQLGGTAIRLGASTSITLLNLDDRIAQVELSQGAMTIGIRQIKSNQALEVDTANLAYVMHRVGKYRIETDPGGDSTAVAVLSGQADIYGDGASYTVQPQQGFRFYGTGLADYERLATRRDDALDQWTRERDRQRDNSASARFVSPDVVGYEDLDTSGTWRNDPTYGNVWTPSRVPAGWAPYRDGHWAWIDPWGWTWVDDAPWGYAVSHYGRWANIRGAWGWVPGPPREQAVYAPAMVAFVDNRDRPASGSLVGVLAAAIAWFPLAPREVYQPSYPVSREYFERINRSNASIPPATITNVYNTTNVTRNSTVINNTTNVTQVVYANQQVPGAVIAVPVQAFVQSRAVAGAALKVPREAIAGAPVAHIAAVAPLERSVHGGAAAAASRPPVRDRAVVARTQPPPPPVAFSTQQTQLAAKPGTPISDVQRKAMTPAVAAVAQVNVVTTAQATPTTPPPTIAPDARSKGERTRESAKGVAAGNHADKGERGREKAPRPESAKADAAKAGTAGSVTIGKDATEAAARNAEKSRTDAADAAARANGAKAEAAAAEVARVNAVKAAAAKSEAARMDAAAGTAKANAAKAEATRAETARVNAAKAEASRRDAAADAERIQAAKAEAARSDAAKAEASRRDAVADLAKANAAKAEATRAETARVNAAKAEAARSDAAVEASRVKAAKVEAARAEAARASSAQAAAAKAEASRLATAAEAARANAAKADAAKAEVARTNAAKAETASRNAAKGDGNRESPNRGAPPHGSPGKSDPAKGPAAKVDPARDDSANDDEDRKGPRKR